MRRIQKRQRDRQRTAPVGICQRCGDEQYPGGSCWRLGGRTLCGACAAAWALEELAALRLDWGEVRP